MRRLLIGVLIGALLGWFARRYLEERESGAGWPVPAGPVTLWPEEEPKATAPAAARLTEDEGLLGYCVRCRTKRPIADPQPATTPTGRSAVRGVCPVCGTSMFRFVRAR